MAPNFWALFKALLLRAYWNIYPEEQRRRRPKNGKPYGMFNFDSVLKAKSFMKYPS